MPGTVETSNFSYIHPGFNSPGTHFVQVTDPTSGAVATSNTFNVVAMPAITPSVPVGTIAGQLFTFTGTLANYLSVPTLYYSIDGAAPVMMTGVTLTGWSMRVSAPASGTHTIVVSDTATPPVTGSAIFNTLQPAKSITVAAISGVVAGGTIQLTGTLSNYATIPSLTYSFDGNVTKTAIVNVTLTDFNNVVLAPAIAGSYTVIVSDGTNNGQATFTVAAASKTITIAAIATATAGSTIPFTGTLAGFVAVPTLTYSLDSGSATPVTGVVQNGWSMTLTAPAAGAHTITVTDAADSITTPATNFTTTAVIKTIQPASPSGTVQGVAFAFTGTLTGFGVSTPTLTYAVDGGSPTSLTGVTPTGWSENITIAAAGAHTITVADAADNLTGSTSFTTAAQTTKTIVPAAPSVATTQDVAFVFSGTIGGYSTAPALTYAVNNGVPIAMTGVTSTGWSMTIAVGTSGSNVITVSDGAGNSGSVSFTTAVATRTISPNAPALPVAGSTITFTGSFNGYAAAPILQYKIDSGSYITMTGVVENAGSQSFALGSGIISETSPSTASAANQSGNIWPWDIVYNQWNGSGTYNNAGGQTGAWGAWATFGSVPASPFILLQISPFPRGVNGDGKDINGNPFFNINDLLTNHAADYKALALSCQAIANQGKGVLAVIGWEWNRGGANDFGWDASGNEAAYIAVWQQMATAFQVNAPGVLRGWAMNHAYNYSGSAPSDFYPGDAFVDALGVEAYQQYIIDPNGNIGTAIDNDFGWLDAMTKATFLGSNHPAAANGSFTYSGKTYTVTKGAAKYGFFAEWQQDHFVNTTFITDVYAWMRNSVRNNRFLVALYWNSWDVDAPGQIFPPQGPNQISTSTGSSTGGIYGDRTYQLNAAKNIYGNQTGSEFVAATVNTTFGLTNPLPRLGTGASNGGTWSMSIPAPATSGAHTITVTDQANSVTSGAIPFTVADTTHIPVLDARYQNPTQKFTDAQGVVWNISSNAQCVANGIADPPTQAVSLMALTPGGYIHQYGTGAWYVESQNNDSFVSETNPLPAGLAIRCADLLSTFGYQVNIDQGMGVSNPSTIATCLTYLNSTLVRQQAAPTHSPNLAGLATAMPTLRFLLTPMLATSTDFNGSGTGEPIASANKTTIPPATQLIDFQLNVWTLVASNGGQCAINGTVVAVTANVTEMAYVVGPVSGYSNTIWQLGTGLWYPAVVTSGVVTFGPGQATSPLL